MRRSVQILILLVLAPVLAFSQSKREWLQYGDEAFANGDYASAAYFYQKVLDKKAVGSRDIVYPYDAKPWTKPEKVNDSIPLSTDTTGASAIDSTKTKAAIDTAKSKEPKNIITAIRYPYVVHQIAESYRLNHDNANAAIWYQKSMLNKSPLYPDERYWYAMTLVTDAKYDQAIKEFETYKTENKDSASYMFARTEKMILSCTYAGDPQNIKEGIIVQELDTIINSGTSNFALNFYGDNNELTFTSGRNGNKTPEGEEENARFYSDLYTVKKNGNGWDKPEAIGAPINSPAYEAAGVLSINRDLFFFTRWTGPGKTQSAIYVSKALNNIWLAPQKLNSSVNAEGYSSMQPALSYDGTKLYFASNRPGGKGKMDIWVCTLDEAGNPGPPVNLGPRINTAENEVSPSWHDKTTTLYYSSDGNVGYGGLDIYKAYATDEDSVWSTPINMGYPINSSRDDSYFVMQRDQLAGYFSSDRKMCEGCAGGSCFRIYKIEKQPLVFNVSGKVFNSETNEPIANSLLTFKDINDDLKPYFIITDENGAYSSPLHEDMEFYIKAQKNKFFGDAATVSTKGLTESKEFNQDFFLTPIPPGDIVIPGIEYDYNSSTLRPSSKVVLDSLVDFLNLNNNISIEISSHTDTRGKDEYNLKLSNERAKSVVDYLISKGIDAARLIPQGYGETKPLVSDAEIAKLKTKPEQEAAHQKNRRTAFRTTKEDAIQVQ